MTTEETELTFVRCPNCRSLIPAIATRCRMCGAQFEKKADSETDPSQAAKQQQQSRVRQRTISASPEEVEQIKREAAAETPPDAAFRLGGPARREESEAVEDEDSGTEDTHHASSVAANVEESIQFNAPQEAEEDWSDDTEFGAEDEGFGEDEDDDADGGSEVAAEADQPREGKRRRRRRRRKKNQGGEGTVGAGAAPASTGFTAPAASRPLADTPRQPEPRQPEPRHQEPRHQEQRRESAPLQAAPVAHVQSEPRHHGGSGSGAGEQPVRSDGSLIGWLVSYGENPRGHSTELRAGKFFVGRQKLRANDFIVSDSSVSTPHCMLTSGGSEGLVVQDLMSENGTSVRRAGSDSFSPVQQPVAVHHGDTLRFGQYELLVCLLPKGRAS